MSSLSSSQNDTDSGDDRSNFSISENQNSVVDEENRDGLDVLNETPRIRVVPFIMSPMPFSPRMDSPPNIAADTPTTSANNNAPPASVSSLGDDDSSHNVVVMIHE